MRFIKGSSLKGYAGIPKITNEDNYNIYRPLLSISKKEIAIEKSFLDTKNIASCNKAFLSPNSAALYK